MEVLSFACGLTDKPPEILHLVFDRIAKFFIEEKRALITERKGTSCSKLRESKRTLDILWTRILTRRKEMEDIRERTSTLHNSDWFVCPEHTTDFVPSRVYAIRIEKHSSPYPAAYVFQDPDYLNDIDPSKYIIFAPDESSIPYAVGLIKNLCAHLDIKRTGVYNEQLLLRVNKDCASKDKFSVLKGEVMLVIHSESKENSLLSVIEAIQQCAGQNVALREIAMVSFRWIIYPEQITKTVWLSPNVKSLVIDTGVPSAVIQHLARELYGCDEMRSPSSEIQPDLNIKGSSFEILKIWDQFGSTELSFSDFNCLVRPARLTHLREIQIPNYYLDNFLGSLDRDNLSLETFTLRTLLRNIAHTAFEVAEPMGESLISEEEEPTGLGGVDFTKTRGKLVNLKLLTVMQVLPKSFENLLDSRSPSLKRLRLDFDSFSETDLERVFQILAKVSLHLEELSIFSHCLVGNLGNIFGSIHKKRSTFYL